MRDLLHQTWFWGVLIAAPVVTVIGILARLARREPPPNIGKNPPYDEQYPSSDRGQ